MTPKLIKDPLVAGRRAIDGVKNRHEYDEGVEVGMLDTVYQGVLGITPRAIQRHNEAKGYLYDRTKALGERTKQLKYNYIIAMENGDVDTAQDVLEAIRRFNYRNPTLAISMKDIAKSQKLREKIQESMVHGVRIQKGYADVVQGIRYLGE